MGKLLVGDVFEQIRTLPDDSVDCCVTSPPYWGLRDYGNDGQIGLEKTPEEYVAKMVEVFREVKRVLKPNGTLWLNLGDSYNGSGKAGSNPEYQKRHTEFGKPSTHESRFGMPTKVAGLKPKDLVGIPWRVAFALQTDGWWLRQDIIWAKPNPMPESVTDRCTKSHEYIFLLTKSARYYFDAKAIHEDGKTYVRKASGYTTHETQGCYDGRRGKGFAENNTTTSGRNKRDVWTIPVRPFKGAHFATFPSYLPEICIKAGTSEKGCCSKCGSAWEKVVEKGKAPKRELRAKMVGVIPGRNSATRMNSVGMETKPVLGVSWRKTCSCQSDVIPSVVFDPFFGAGTVGLVAEHLKRDWIGIEINPEYAKIAKERINGNH